MSAITLEEAKNEFIQRGYKPLFDEYINSREKLLIENNQGYKVLITFSAFKNGVNPALFNICNPFTIDNIKTWIIINNIEYSLLSKEYKGNHKKLKMFCNEHGEFEISWANLQSGYGCKLCGIEKSKNLRKTKLLKVKNEFIKQGYKPLFDSYNNAHEKLLVETSSGYKVTTSFNMIKRNLTPHIFHKGNPYTIENIKLWLKLNNSPYILLSKEYKGSSSKLEIVCKNHGIFKMSWNNLNCGQNCPKCNQSKGEKVIEDLLTKNNIYYLQQKEFDNLVGLKNKNLSYDFYLPNSNLLIEYQGQFHDGSAKFQTNKKLVRQQEHDKRKREYARQNGIKLLEIWYWDFDKIEEILERELFKLKV